VVSDSRATAQLITDKWLLTTVVAQCRIHPEAFQGDLVKKITAYLLFVLLGLALSGPTVAHARTNSAQSDAQKQSQKQWKKYNKQQHKQQKKQLKEQKKQIKNWKKDHPTKVTTT
jgi:hypothetical protein